MSVIVQESPRPAPSIVVREHDRLEALDELAPRWDELAQRAAEPTPFLGSAFLRSWWRAFGRGRPRLVTVESSEGRLLGGAMFDEHRGRFDGIPVRVLALAANAHSNRATLLADASAVEPVAAALAAWADAQRPRWTVLRIDECPADDPVASAFVARLAALGHPTGCLDGARPPYLDLGPDWEAGLKSKWRSNLRNREKRLLAKGDVVHETVTEAIPDLDARLAECFALEALAWKGHNGSAILSSPRTHRFYREIARQAAIDKTLRLQTLRLDGRLAAFQLDLEQAGTEYVLKIGYDPSIAALGPGALLMRRTIGEAAARGLTRLDLLGDAMPWKRDWTAAFRQHVKRFVFSAGPAGRALHALKFRLLPLARRAFPR